MPTPDELKKTFWRALRSDQTMMLGLDGAEDGHTRPMTAQIEGEHGPIWFFTTSDNALASKIGGSGRAIATFTSRAHDLFATVHGRLCVDTDRATVDRLWNSAVAAWYEGGKDDPRLVLLRLDAEKAEIWQNASNLMAGIRMLLGADPKAEAVGHVAKVQLK